MSDRTPGVSVIIPTYNRAHLIDKPIQSVLSQTYQDFEIIVVDDCSSDNTESVLKGYKDPRIRYIRHQHNSGPGIARNTGIEYSRGQYVAFLDSDDSWLPEKLEKQIKVLQQSDPDVGAVYTWLCAVDENNNVKRIKAHELRGFIRDELIYGNYVGTPSTVMVKRECLEKVKGFDPEMPRFTEDIDLWVRLATHYKFEVIPEVLVHYFDSSKENRLTNNSESVVKSIMAFVDKYHNAIELDRNYKKIGQLSQQKKANHLFGLGNVLMCHGTHISHDEAVKTGQRYLLASWRADVFNLKYLFYYSLALLGGNIYVSFVQTKNSLYSQIKRIRGKVVA